jgi:hypothetical protein
MEITGELPSFCKILEEIMKDEKLSSGVTTAQAKKTYSKPVLSQIRLVAEEAVLALCKMGGGYTGRGNCLDDMSCAAMPHS